MEKIIERLKQQVDYALRSNEDIKAASWAYEEGVLISAQDAQDIVDFYDSTLSQGTRPVITPEMKLRNAANYVKEISTPTGSSGAHGRTKKHYQHDRYTIAFHASGLAEIILKYLDGELEPTTHSDPF